MTKNSYNSSLPKEDRILLSYIDDLYKKYISQEISLFSHFLDLRQQSLLAETYKEKIHFFGGVEEAERKIAYFGDDINSFPITCMKITVPKNAQKLTHSRILGTIMSLGIERDILGDILLPDDYTAYAFIKSDFENFFESNLIKIGKDYCSLSFDSYSSIDFHREHSFITVSIPSLRIDCIVAEVCHCSREKAADIIRNKDVFINYLSVEKTSLNVKDNDVFSIRRHGKYKVLGVSKISKKGRLSLDLEKY